LETAVPGAGPIGFGPRADRWHDDVQRTFYNGWKSIHGLKHQTRENAYGMCEDIYGPTSLRKNDLRLLGNSRLNGRLNALPRQWQTYGDSIYPLLTNIMSGGQHSQFWKKLRCSIEWNYSVTSYNLFKYLSHFNKLRLLSSDKVTKVYTVGTFLRNCHVALYGCQSMEYFDLRLPVDMLERYTRLH
jgi:hypothetical protein